MAKRKSNKKGINKLAENIQKVAKHAARKPAKKAKPKKAEKQDDVIGGLFFTEAIIHQPDGIYKNCTFVQCKIIQVKGMDDCHLIDCDFLDHPPLHMHGCIVRDTKEHKKAQLVDALIKFDEVLQSKEGQRILSTLSRLDDAKKERNSGWKTHVLPLFMNSLKGDKE